MRILLVEDEENIQDVIKLNLEMEDYEVVAADNGKDALKYAKEQHFDLLVLDVMLPGIDGLEVCTRIRKVAGAHDPYILMLTAKGEEFDRVIGLSTGADDYLVKPFSPLELVARVRALLRRSLRQESQSQVYRTSHFTVDVDRHVATRELDGHSEELELTTIEFDLLATFLSHPGRAWSRTHLVEKLWGDDFFGEERVVDTHVARLRKKIEVDSSNPQFIKTVVGTGYKFEDEG